MNRGAQNLLTLVATIALALLFTACGDGLPADQAEPDADVAANDTNTKDQIRFTNDTGQPDSVTQPKDAVADAGTTPVDVAADSGNSDSGDAAELGDSGLSDAQDGSSDGEADTSDGEGGSCVGKCGKYENGAACQCDSSCTTYGDCCKDYKEICQDGDTVVVVPDGGASDGTSSDAVSSDAASSDAGASDAGPKSDASAADAGGADISLPPGASCKGRCGEFNNKKACQCDAQCGQFGDCCKDFEKICVCKVDKDCDDGDECTQDGCKTGVCLSNAVTPAKCNDGNACTDDGCEKGKGCTHALLNIIACDDGDSCTDADHCVVGKCAGTKAKCDDANPCTDDSCDKVKGCVFTNNTKSCGDVANKCTGGAQCKAGACVPNKPVNCDDGKACTADKCAPLTGKCVHLPISDGGACDDGNKCTSKDTCKAGSCIAGPATKCDDGDACTADSCDKAKGCGHVAAKCDDGDLCTTDNCNKATGKCVNAAKSCDDKNTCTVDSCDKATGKCGHKSAADGALCSDGNACTKPDACKAGVCGGPLNACDDGNPCTIDTCQIASGSCVHVAAKDGSKCEDGNACTLPDLCAKGVCKSGKDACTPKSVYKTSFPCGENGGWILDPVNKEPATGWHIDATANPPGFKSEKCSLNLNNGKDFADGNKQIKAAAASPKVALKGSNHAKLTLWTWQDIEASATYDQRWVDISDDGFAKNVQSVRLLDSKGMKAWAKDEVSLASWLGKTIQVRFRFDSYDGINNTGKGWYVDDVEIIVSSKPDSCAGMCGKTALGANCQCDAKCKANGNCCPDYVKLCTGCKSALDCTDGNVCTVDKCDAKTGQCNSSPVAGGGKCSDNNPCTLKDACKAGVCAGVINTCDDDNSCTADFCDLSKGCQHTPANAGQPCNDGSLCTEKDACDKVGKCGGTAKKCDDGNSCTDDSCDAKTGKCGVAPKKEGSFCTDGNGCTTGDKCTAGKCAGAQAKDGALCSDGNLCTLNDACKAGVCAGTGKCDDKNDCTVDSCDVKTGKCANAAIKDGAKCTDGNACTTPDACKAGKCVAGKDGCKWTTALTNAFACGDKAWALNPVNKEPAVGWHVDDTANPPGFKSAKCSLNFNNGKDFKDAKKVAGTATSGTITLANSDHAEVTFWTWQDMETSTTYDQRWVDVSDDNFAKNIESIRLDEQVGLKKWAKVNLALTNWLGKKIKVRLRFDSVDAINNTGQGWFVDDVVVRSGALPGSCAGLCGKFVSGASCQCDSQCKGFGDCCGDYVKLCTGCKADKDCQGDACNAGKCDMNAGACSAVPAADGGKCDDANPCTLTDVCKAGKCAGVANKCDDKNICTSDFCDKAKGCQHSAIAGSLPCDDGMACTEADACSKGVCVGKKRSCDDANACTTDACDAKSGLCTFTKKKDGTLCSDGKLCTTGDTCKDGACAAGKAKCDDNNSCTSDACDPVNGKCTHNNLQLGAKCDDGDVCTAGDQCNAGKCVGGNDSCTYTNVFSDPFACGAPAKWTFVPANKEPAAGWHIDATANPPGYKSAKCSLNVNDGKTYENGGKVLKATATSVPIKLPMLSKKLLLKMWSYQDVEASSSYDKRYVEVSLDGFKTVAKSFLLPNGTVTLKKWQSLTFDLKAWAGKTVSLRVRFDTVDAVNNKTAGWFVDDVIVQSGALVTGANSCIGRCGKYDNKFSCQCDAQCGQFKDCCTDYGKVCAPPPVKCTTDKACDDNSGCTVDKCDLNTGKCSNVAAKDGVICSDGNLCTMGEVCKAGKCGAGKPKECNDNKPCTSDLCSTTTGVCKFIAKKDGDLCSDGDKCTSGDVCKAGKCAGKAKCDDGKPCTEDNCSAVSGACVNTNLPLGTSCDDGDACTSGDQCNLGVCESGVDTCTYKDIWKNALDCGQEAKLVFSPANKEPAVGWHLDGTPNPPGYKSAKCSLNVNNGKNYSNGQKVIADASTLAVALPKATKVELRLWSYQDVESSTKYDQRYVQVSVDGFQTVAHSWQLKNNSANKKKWEQLSFNLTQWGGKSVHVRVHFDTFDAVSNTTAGWFVDDLGIRVGAPASSPTSCVGRCGKYDSKLSCQCDAGCGQFKDCCTDYGKVCAPPPPKCATDKACDDNSACTADKCDLNSGACSHASAKDGVVCSDGNLCTSGDACKAGKCVAKSSKSCNDNNDCTADSCDAATGKCVYKSKADGAFCADGDPCTVGDTCKVGKCTAGGPKCNDKNPCTVDKCDPQSGACSAVAGNDGAKCTDDQLCTSDDKCKAGKCGGVAVKCDDKNSCTADSCDPKTGKCTSKASPDGGNCDDGNQCTLGDTCKAGKCVAGVDKCTYKDVLKDSFNCGAQAKWTFVPNNKEPAVGWHIDATPNPPGFKSEKCSLNVNNGKDYSNSQKVLASATSQLLKLPAAKSLPLSFWSWQELESGTAYDRRWLQVSVDGFKTVAKAWQLANSTANKAKWEQLTYDLGPWAGKSVQVRFLLDTVDAVSNTTRGWFVDDLGVKSGDIVASATSCYGRCDKFQVGAKCQCDAGCIKFKDCCSDYQLICAPGCQSKADCDDGNACTIDACDAGSGKCSSVPAKDGFSCEDGSKCTLKEVCKAGKCTAGSTKSCDDNDICTIDACDASTGKCTSTPAKDGGACDDGRICSFGDKCTKGKCGGTEVCIWKTLFSDTVSCTPSAKWTFQPAVKEPAVAWHADATPASPAAHSAKCSLNVNNGKNYSNGKQVLASAVSAEFTVPKDAVDTSLTLWTYNGVEKSDKADLRQIQISEDGFKTSGKVTLNNVTDPVAWQQRGWNLNSWKGKTVQMRLYFDSDNGANNTGPGWFVDDVLMRAASLPKEWSCTGRCSKFDGSAKCQCDSQCASYKDCCPDIKLVCK